MLKTIKGNVTISRPQTNSGEPYVSITVADAANFQELIEICLPVKDFAEALFGMGFMEAEVRGRPEVWQTLGYVWERKQVDVSCPIRPLSSDNEVLQKLLAPHEVDGWKGSLSDLKDSRRPIIDGRKYIQFARLVPPEAVDE